MGSRKDLSYEKKETETPYIYTEVEDLDEALRLASLAIDDAKSFWGYVKATGVEPVAAMAEAEQPPGPLAKAGYFIAGSATGIAGLLLLLLSLGVI